MTIATRLPRGLSASWPRLRRPGRLRRVDAAHRQRRRIEDLAPELLRDIGLTPDDLARMLGG